MGGVQCTYMTADPYKNQLTFNKIGKILFAKNIIAGTPISGISVHELSFIEHGAASPLVQRCWEINAGLIK